MTGRRGADRRVGLAGGRGPGWEADSSRKLLDTVLGSGLRRPHPGHGSPRVRPGGAPPMLVQSHVSRRAERGPGAGLSWAVPRPRVGELRAPVHCERRRHLSPPSPSSGSQLPAVTSTESESGRTRPPRPPATQLRPGHGAGQAALHGSRGRGLPSGELRSGSSFRTLGSNADVLRLLRDPRISFCAPDSILGRAGVPLAPRAQGAEGHEPLTGRREEDGPWGQSGQRASHKEEPSVGAEATPLSAPRAAGCPASSRGAVFSAALGGPGWARQAP